MTGSVVVVGAINVDLVVSGAGLPKPGETVSGGVFAQHQGGKGGNQAVAAARALGGHGVVMVGSVGNDALGHDALDALRPDRPAGRIPFGIEVARQTAPGDPHLALPAGDISVFIGVGDKLIDEQAEQNRQVDLARIGFP